MNYYYSTQCNFENLGAIFLINKKRRYSFFLSKRRQTALVSCRLLAVGERSRVLSPCATSKWVGGRRGNPIPYYQKNLFHHFSKTMRRLFLHQLTSSLPTPTRANQSYKFQNLELIFCQSHFNLF